MGINGFICGSHNPESIHAVEHANAYYASIRKRTGDCETISNNTKFTLEQISLIKSYIFYAQHKLCNGIERFCPDYMMGESWRRLSSSNKNHIQPHDIILLNHELLEIHYIMQGYDQDRAHTESSKKYDYHTAALNFYRNQGFNI